ncbi:MAG: hypothetical protein ACPL08_08675 [Dictyoglomus turgidum]
MVKPIVVCVDIKIPREGVVLRDYFDTNIETLARVYAILIFILSHIRILFFAYLKFWEHSSLSLKNPLNPT